MELRVLGPLQVVDGGKTIALGGRRQRLVLACLLAHANETVPTGKLIDEVWGDVPPEAARNSLQSYVSHLRKALGADRIPTAPGGYQLHVDPSDIDARRFEMLVEQARGEVVTDPGAAIATFDAALALWHGPAYSDLAEERALAGEIARLDELRLSATEHKLAAEIAAGRHSAIVGQLEALTTHHQLRERLWAHLMLALYRSGRQGDALAAYGRARAVLRDELGIDPSPELRELHERILRQDPDLRGSPGRERRRGELAAGTTFAGCRIERVLGRGGTSVVYLAEDVQLGRHVALKLLGAWLDGEPGFRDRFLRESRLAASLEHPNVVPIYEAGDEGGQLFITMRYVDGTDLRTLLDDVGALEPDRAVAIVKQVAAALDAAHAQGLVHRDVKPANVLLAGEDVFLSDFGLTKRTTTDDTSIGADRFVGTLDYAPPEQFEGRPLDGRADQYSLGCVLYECLTGEPPFRRPNPAALMRAHLEEPPPALTAANTELPLAFDAVIARALAKTPSERFASCGKMASAAAAATSSNASEVSTPPSDRRQATRRDAGRRRRRRLTAAAAAMALVGTGLAVTVPRLLDGDAAASLMSLEPGMAILDASDGAVVAHIPPSSVKQPVEAIFADGSFWVINLQPLSFVQIDAESGLIVRQIGSPLDDPSYLTVDGDDLWITHYTEPSLSRVSIGLGREVNRFELPGDGGSGGVVVADGSLWVARREADGGLGILARLDPRTGEAEHLFRSLPGSYALAYGDDGAVWTAGTWGAVNRINPQDNTITSADVGGRNFYIAAGDGYGWTTDEAKGVVHQVDSAGTVVAAYRSGDGARSVAFSDGVVWVGNQVAGSVTGVDAETGATRTYTFSHPIQSIAAGADRVLVQLVGFEPFDELTAAPDGAIAKFLVGGYQFDSVDPSVAVSELGRQVARATCAGLLRSDADGQLVPEIAAAMPSVSADGRTYTFTIRSGYRFSAPSGEAVTAETFRHSLMRAIALELGGFAGGNVEVTDVRAEGTTLRVAVEDPPDDLLDRLAAPNFCPVPVDTPMVAGGAARSVGDLPGERTVPSAGPYYIDRHAPGSYLVLRRNPNYNGPRSHRFDAIVLREGFEAGRAHALVDAGEWDGILHMPGEDGPVESVISDRIGCQSVLPEGIDLAAICRA